MLRTTLSIATVFFLLTAPSSAVVPAQGPNFAVSHWVASGCNNAISLDQVPSARPAQWYELMDLSTPKVLYWNMYRPQPGFVSDVEIPLPDYTNVTKANAEAAARNFLARWANLLGMDASGEARLAFADPIGNTFAVEFHQWVEGRKVLGARVPVRLDDKGIVFAFGSTWFSECRPASAPALPDDQLIALAREPMDRANVLVGKVELKEEAIIPDPVRGNVRFVIVRRADVTTTDPPACWVTWMDRADGRVLWRYNSYSYATISGTVTQQYEDVAPVSPWGTVLTANAPHMTVNVPSQSVGVNADINGYYSVNVPSTGSYQMLLEMKGPYAWVVQQVLNNDTLILNANGGSVTNPAWTTGNAQRSSLDAYHAMMTARAFLKALDPATNAANSQMQAIVEVSGTCNAFYNGTLLQFYQPGGGCQDMGRLADVVMHEYGHSHTYDIYNAGGLTPDPACGEAWSDYLTCALTNQPHMGRGFFGANTYLRNADTTMTTADSMGEEHNDGIILLSAHWDLRQALSPRTAYADSLWHFARSYRATMWTQYVEDLVNTDRALSPSVSHECQIRAAYAAHGIGTVTTSTSITHTPLPDTDNTTAPYTVSANATASCGVADSVLCYYRVTGTWVRRPMSPAGGGVYTTTIPAQPSMSVVEYFLVLWVDSAWTRSPRVPGIYHNFIVGTCASNAYPDDFEADLGWSRGDTGDNATTGLWVRADPIGTIDVGLPAQPEDDHTPSGTMCWVTGNGYNASNVGFDDVDNGKTTLKSPVYNLSTATTYVISYWHWYYDQTALDDTFQVDVTTDGGANWTAIERVPWTYNQWHQVRLSLNNFITPGAATQFRVVAFDRGTPSLVEAALDDWTLVVPCGALDVASSPAAPALAVVPSPARDRASLRLAGRMDLSGREVALVDALGHPVRGYRLTWPTTGLDLRGLPAGVYFLGLDGERVRVVKE